MGNLVQVTLHLDAFGKFREDPKGFGEAIIQGIYEASQKGVAVEVPFSNEANSILVHPHRHMDNPALYVQMGNTCFLLDPYDSETGKLAKKNKKFYGEMVNYVEKLARELRLLQNGSG